MWFARVCQNLHADHTAPLWIKHVYQAEKYTIQSLKSVFLENFDFVRFNYLNPRAVFNDTVLLHYTPW